MKSTTRPSAIPNTRFKIGLCLLALLTMFVFSYPSFASSIKELKGQQRNEILFHIHNYYVEDLASYSLTNSKYSLQQFQHLYAKLDRYSEYLDEHELAALFDNTNGRYTGLGIEVKQLADHVTIVNVINSSPAQNAGVAAGDIIISVNDLPTENSSLNEVAQLIKESKLNPIKLTVTRDNHTQPLTFTISRSEISLASVTSYPLGSGTGYLAINSFSNHTLHEVALQVAALQSHYGALLKGLVIDLRDNPGGTLPSAVAVSDLFLQSGTIVTTKGRFHDANQAFNANRGDILKGAPIVVLINENSASAAEILAAALKDNQRAKVVGKQSFGKGSVQSLIPLGNGKTALKLTTAKYYTPSGKSIDGIGITPDVTIEQSNLTQINEVATISSQTPKNYPQWQPNSTTDIQLVKAKQILSVQTATKLATLKR